MNKIVIGLLVAVCLLGFALILLNERMGSEVASPTVTEKPQQLASQEIPQPVAQRAQEKNSELGEGASEDGSKVTQEVAVEVKGVESTVVRPDIANKALDEVLSERTAEVQAPNQQASIVQQTSVTDLVVESSQLPKIISDIPRVAEPQAMEVGSYPVSADMKESADKPSTSTAVIAKEENVKPDGGEKSGNPKVAVSPQNNEVKANEVAKSTVGDKKDTGKGASVAKAKTLSVTLFTVFTRENGATVRLRTNGPLPYSSAQLQNPKTIVKELQKPDRLMFDLTGAWEIKEPAVPNNIVVNKVRVGKMADRARIVVDLKDKPRKIRVKIADKKDGIDIFLDR